MNQENVIVRKMMRRTVKMGRWERRWIQNIQRFSHISQNIDNTESINRPDNTWRIGALTEMAQCKQSSQEYTQDAFAPMVAVMCSHDTEMVCQKNNLTFTEIIQPFCRLTTEGKDTIERRVYSLAA